VRSGGKEYRKKKKRKWKRKDSGVKPLLDKAGIRQEQNESKRGRGFGV
jgi:hypothetical protein